MKSVVVRDVNHRRLKSHEVEFVRLKKDEEDCIWVLLRVKGPQALDPINILVEEEMEPMTAFHRAAATEPLLSY